VKIPLVDLDLQNQEISADVARGFERVILNNAFILGPPVSEFEERFSAYCDVQHCIGVANGTDAVELCLRSVGVGAGDEVIVPAFTFVATALGALRCGATPVFADIEEGTFLVDPAQVEAKITAKTRAIVAVDLYGQVADFEALEGLGAGRDVAIVEDAAQAQGAKRHGRPAGSFGAVSAMSFYPAKNLGAYGDAGAVLTHSEQIAERVRQLRQYGSETKYLHPVQGFNSRLDSLQAVVLNAKLERLDAWNAQRQAAARRYDALFAESDGVRIPTTLEGNDSVYHLYVVRVAQRDRVLAELNEMGIGAAVHYPHALPSQGAFAELGWRPGDFPVAEQASREVLSLPIFPGITEAQQDAVVKALVDAL